MNRTGHHRSLAIVVTSLLSWNLATAAGQAVAHDARNDARNNTKNDAKRNAPTESPLNWVDVSNTALADPGANQGSAWGDYDADGDLDLYITRWNAENSLLENQNGVFVDVTAGPLGLPGASKSGRAVWADYDNDGDLDLYIAQGSNKNLVTSDSALLRNDGASGFVNVTNGDPLAMQYRLARTAAWADYDNDGLVDLYASGVFKNRLMRNMGGDTFVKVSSTLIDNPGIGRGIEWCDYDNDGDQDLFGVNGDASSGACDPALTNNFLLRNDGVLGFSSATAGTVGDDRDARACSWGDYDNDGDFDLFITNTIGCTSNSDNQLLQNNGDGTFTDVTTPILATGTASRCSSWVDIDNDGLLDLFITGDSIPNVLLRNDGLGGFEDVTTPEIAQSNESTFGAAWADHDGDGDMDVYISNVKAPNALLQNELDNTNHWIEISLEGTQSNRSAIGARITAVAGGITQMREIRSGSGYSVQHMLTAHFGLGAADNIDVLWVQWPSGVSQIIENVSADQILTIVEPERACEADCDGSGALDIFDFLCFQNEFVAGRSYACDCDVSTGNSVCDIFDFLCFQSLFVQGCP